MKINYSISCNNSSLFHSNPKSVFNPAPPMIINNVNNYSCIFPPYNPLNSFNTYQNLYSQIISKDKTAINAFKNQKQNSLKYKPFLSNIKIIINEESECKKASTSEENEKNQGDEFLGKKTKRAKKNKFEIFEISKSSSTNNESFNKTNRGRKKKEVEEKGNHTKFTDDNMMRKIKCHYFNHINNSLNNSLKNKPPIFLKLDNFINENLKRDYNMELMNKTIKDIYTNSKISNKYKKKNEENNKQLVEKIYSENNEVDTIQILNKTYFELFSELIKDKLDEFCSEILKKEEKNGLPHDQANDFSTKMKNLCMNYKEWFAMKRGRGGKR